MVWLGKDLKDHLVPTPCHEQGQLPLDQVAPSPGFERIKENNGSLIGHSGDTGIGSFIREGVPWVQTERS